MRSPAASTRVRASLSLLAIALIAAACSSGSTDDPVADSTSAAETDTETEDSDEGSGDAEAEAAEPVTLEFLNFTAGPDHEEKLAAIIADFEAEYPHVTIEPQNLGFEEYFTQLQTRVAGDVAPDTFELNYENFVTYAASGALLDLESVGGDGVDPSVFFPRAYDAFNYEGTQYGLPESFSVVVLYYNKALFDQAGLDYPDESWTWEDELAAAEAITALGDDIWGVYQPVQFFEFYKTLAQNGGDFFNDDVTAAAFNSEAGVEAAHWLVDKVGSVMPTEADMAGRGDAELFQSGQLGLWHTGIWMFNVLAEMEEWDIAVEPGGASDASAFFANGAVASVTTDHPQEAALWLQHLASSETTVHERLTGEWELPAVVDESLLAPYLEQRPPENRQAVFDALEAVVVPPVITRQQELQDAVTLALQRAIEGIVSVEDAVAEAEAAVNELLR